MSASTFVSPYFFLPLSFPLNIKKDHNHPFINHLFPQGTCKLLGIRPLCTTTPKFGVQAISDVSGTGPSVIKISPMIVDDEIHEPGPFSDLIKEHVCAIKSIFGGMGDGQISVSAYDTAWVALVKDVNGSGGPQFPSSLQWIVDNQLPNGSWGDGELFSAYDRLLNTLACVVALKSWNIRPDKCAKGLKFLKENASELEKENAEHMLIGFEVTFPSLLEVASGLNIEIPFSSTVLKDIYARRDLKYAKIPKEVMHNVPTTLLYSLEGMAGLDLDWEKLLKLQDPCGSFFSSPSSTAFALMQTKDEKCLRYLHNMVQKFNGGVPCVCPVDLFEHNWVVDRLQRLGISRYFQPEIKNCVEYVSRYWNQDGISHGVNVGVPDLDDTSMGFRILRLHGYNVSTESFHRFEEGGEFFCYMGESNPSVTAVFSLYRAAQLMFSGEKILEEAKQFCLKFLRGRQATNELLDKWVIMKDLPGEVEYALEVPWYASLPRVEARFYIEQYGGDHDVWVGKVLYRMPYVNSKIYLEMAKFDFNNCQALHRMEWDSMQKWFMENKFGDFGMNTKTLLVAYFLAAANIFEPERSTERLAWTKTSFLMDTISSYFDHNMNSRDQRRTFVQDFKNINSKIGQGNTNGRRMEAKGTTSNLISILLTTMNHLSLEALGACSRDINPYLRHSWEKWIMMWEEEGDMYNGAAELLINTINLCSGCSSFNGTLSHPSYGRLISLSNRVCRQLGPYQKLKVYGNGNDMVNPDIMDTEIEAAMQELVQLLLQNSVDDIGMDVKQTFFAVARSFYYAAHCDLRTINFHIAKVLFEPVNCS